MPEEVFRVTKNDKQYPAKSFMRIGTGGMAGSINRHIRIVNRERRRFNNLVERGMVQAVRVELIEVTFEIAEVAEWRDVTRAFGERKRSDR